MSKKIKLLSCCFVLLTAVFVFCFSSNKVSAASANVYPNITDDFIISYGYNEVLQKNGFTLDTNVKGTDYQYQYWIKKQVITSTNPNTKQFIWQILRPFNTSSEFFTADLSSDDIDINGLHNVILRISDDNGNIIDEIYKAFKPKDVGFPVITNISVNGSSYYEGHAIVDRAHGLDIDVYSENSTSHIFKLMHLDNEIASSSDGDFNSIDISGFNLGEQIFSVEMIDSVSRNVLSTKEIKIYVYDFMGINKLPVIKSLVGTSNNEGETEFILKVNYSDGTNIKEEDADMFRYLLSSGKNYNLSSSKTELDSNGVLSVFFNLKYSATGIYYTQAIVSQINTTGFDDKMIVYYNGFSREEVSLTQTSNAKKGINNTDYMSAINTTINIETEGKIFSHYDGENKVYFNNEDVSYAFYREDASGWILIKDYSDANAEGKNIFSWTPMRAGIYNIQTRIKIKGLGEYEKAVTKTYEIRQNLEQGFSGEVFINVTTLDGNSADISALKAGVPYKIKIESESMSDSSLYMFTLNTKSLGTIYVNKFTTSPEIIFVSWKQDVYQITARLIDSSNFGYKDISSKPLTLLCDRFPSEVSDLSNNSIVTVNNYNQPNATTNGQINIDKEIKSVDSDWSYKYTSTKAGWRYLAFSLSDTGIDLSGAQISLDYKSINDLFANANLSFFLTDDLTNGKINVTPSIKDLGSGWKRVSMLTNSTQVNLKNIIKVFLLMNCTASDIINFDNIKIEYLTEKEKFDISNNQIKDFTLEKYQFALNPNKGELLRSSSIYEEDNDWSIKYISKSAEYKRLAFEVNFNAEDLSDYKLTFSIKIDEDITNLRAHFDDQNNIEYSLLENAQVVSQDGWDTYTISLNDLSSDLTELKLLKFRFKAGSIGSEISFDSIRLFK